MTVDNPTDTDTPWRDEELLRELYVEQKRSRTAIGEMLGVRPQTISKWLERHGIGLRTSAEQYAINNKLKPVPLKTDSRGYQMWHDRTGGGQRSVYVHALVAVAHGSDPYTVFTKGENHVHHINNIPFDNRPDNLEVLSSSEHASRHRSGVASYYKITEPDCREITSRYESGEQQIDMANEYGVSQSTIGRHVRGECEH